MNQRESVAGRGHAFWKIGLSTLLLGVAFVATAATVSYEYDAVGRLTKVTYGNGTIIEYGLDASGNRTSISTVQLGSCAFAAQAAEGSDEFTLHATLVRTAPCDQSIAVSVAVQYVSGTGNYQLGPLSDGQSTSIGSAYKLQKISPYYGTVSAGSPLRLKVTWTVTSGNAVISPAEAFVTFYNSDCYC